MFRTVATPLVPVTDCLIHDALNALAPLGDLEVKHQSKARPVHTALAHSVLANVKKQETWASGPNPWTGSGATEGQPVTNLERTAGCRLLALWQQLHPSHNIIQ